MVKSSSSPLAPSAPEPPFAKPSPRAPIAPSRSRVTASTNSTLSPSPNSSRRSKAGEPRSRPHRPSVRRPRLRPDRRHHRRTHGPPHASLILNVEKTDTGITVKRELEEGWFQNIHLPLPAVLMIQSGGTKLRYATLMGIKKAKTKELRKISATDLGQSAAPSAVLEKITQPQKQKSTQIISGSPKEAAATLVEKLKFEVRVI